MTSRVRITNEMAGTNHKIRVSVMSAAGNHPDEILGPGQSVAHDCYTGRTITVTEFVEADITDTPPAPEPEAA